MSDKNHIEVAMPTWNSAGVLDMTLDKLRAALAESDTALAELRIVDNQSTDRTLEIARNHADRHGWPLDVTVADCSLPAARKQLIHAVDTDWFLFLDDDVRVTETYLRRQLAAAAPGVGAVQGRKASRSEHPSEWTRRRARRGGTHATLIRTEAAEGVDYPRDLHVLEDEYLRRHVESAGYLWVFNHQAEFAHANQHRHPIGWREGYLAGKYGLKPFHEVALNVPFAAATGRNPWPHAKRAVGWLAGRLNQSRTAPPVTLPAEENHA